MSISTPIAPNRQAAHDWGVDSAVRQDVSVDLKIIAVNESKHSLLGWHTSLGVQIVSSSRREHRVAHGTGAVVPAPQQRTKGAFTNLSAPARPDAGYVRTATRTRPGSSATPISTCSYTSHRSLTGPSPTSSVAVTLASRSSANTHPTHRCSERPRRRTESTSPLRPTTTRLRLRSVATSVPNPLRRRGALSTPSAVDQLRAEDLDVQKLRVLQPANAEFKDNFDRFRRRTYNSIIQLCGKHLDFVIRQEDLEQSVSPALQLLPIMQVRPVPVMNRIQRNRRHWTYCYTGEITDPAVIAFGPVVPTWGHRLWAEWGPNPYRRRDDLGFRLLADAQPSCLVNVRYTQVRSARLLRSMRTWLITGASR